MKKIDLFIKNYFSKADIRYFILSIILLIVIQILFFFLQRSIGQKIVTSIQSQLRQDLDLSNFHYLSKSISDYTYSGTIECTVIKRIYPKEIQILNIDRGDCNKNEIFLEGAKFEVELTALNGDIYNLKFISNNDTLFYLCLWSIRIFSIIVLLFLKIIAAMNDRAKDLEIQKKTDLANAQIDLSKQVSHDIRSPLSALNMIVAQLKDVPEEKRIIIRSAVNRINDISNELLRKNKYMSVVNEASAIASKSVTNQSISQMIEQTKGATVQLLSPLLDSIVSEKRVQFREKLGVSIECDVTQGYGLFANINATELKRAISNLLNNSCEAFIEEQGKVSVTLCSDINDNVVIRIQDNGKGIPEHILAKLGNKGVSHGKENTQSGSGLGIYHAKKTVEASCGQFIIDSKTGQGTVISMIFEKAPAPNWFVSELEFYQNSIVISLDDDISIHQIWKGRLDSQKASEKGVSHLSFTSGSDFKIWLDFFLKKSDTSSTISAITYLVDYELLNQPQTGLQIIEELNLFQNNHLNSLRVENKNITSQAILVSSRYEEPHIRDCCDRLGVKLIPKVMAGFVPIKIKQLERFYTNELTVTKIKYDLCLIDDDVQIIHALWSLAAKSKGLNIMMFATPEEFVSASDKIDRHTPIYVDVSLGNNVNGLDVANTIHNLGFENINLATGYESTSLKAPNFIRHIVGKDFPDLFRACGRE